MAENKVNTAASIKESGWSDEEKAERAKAASAAAKPADLSEDGVLTNAEVEEIRKEARIKLEAERKKSAKQLLLEQETRRLRDEEGLVTGSAAKDQMVQFTIDLAEYGACVMINSRPYWHGRTYTVPRHVAETLRDVCQRTHQHQATIDGKDKRAYYQQHRETTLSPVKGIKSAPVSPGADVAA